MSFREPKKVTEPSASFYAALCEGQKKAIHGLFKYLTSFAMKQHQE